jgi:endoglucanase
VPMRAVVAVLAVATLGVGLTACSDKVPAAGTGPVGTAAPPAAGGNGSYHVIGNKVMAPNGQQFIPYGFIIYCLAHPTGQGCAPASPGGPNPDRDRISASATFWHANVVRIQVAQEYLFSQSPIDASYLAELDNQVGLATSFGMVAIVTLQEQPFNGPPLPDTSAVRFWKLMARHYKNSPSVFFDLYNQPHLKTYRGEDWMWSIWRNGGTVDTQGPPPVHDTFVGMQSLVNDIRSEGADNVIVAQGNKTSHDLSGIPQYALTGSNVTYGMEPTLGSDDQTLAQWAANWGNLSKSVPVMMEGFQDWPGANNCNPNSPTLLPQLLAYLRSKNLGLIVWSLNESNIIVDSNLEEPTSYEGTTTQPCTGDTMHQPQPPENSTGSVASGQPTPTTPPPATVGPGKLILDFFRANSHPAPALGTPNHGR